MVILLLIWSYSTAEAGQTDQGDIVIYFGAMCANGRLVSKGYALQYIIETYCLKATSL